ECRRFSIGGRTTSIGIGETKVQVEICRRVDGPAQSTGDIVTPAGGLSFVFRIEIENRIRSYGRYLEGLSAKLLLIVRIKILEVYLCSAQGHVGIGSSE